MSRFNGSGNQAGRKSGQRNGFADQRSLEIYQAFMTGYVRRINNATLKVAIGGVRIGCAKYSRLAQINLQSRIITFSRYAIENVPERGRRYLVIHELAHVKEASHNRRFWSIVERYEPDYRKVGRSIQLAFSKNVKQDQLAGNPLNSLASGYQQPGGLPILLPSNDNLNEPDNSDDKHFYCDEDEFDDWGESGIIQGGSLTDTDPGDETHMEDYQSLPSLPHSADLFLFGRSQQNTESI